MTTPASTIEANSTQLSYAVETTWGTSPSTTFQAIRYTQESLSQTKNRTRPSEINLNREAIQAVTTSLSAGGSINYALSFGTFDDLFASAINATWTTLVSIPGVAGDIVLTNTNATTAALSSATANKFQNITAGNYIRLFGFTNPANNGVYYVLTKTDTTHLVLTSFVPTVTETPTGTLAQIRQRNIRNGTGFTSLTIQQKFSNILWLRYPGSYITGFTLTGGVGQMFTGTFNVLAQSEASAITTADTGGILPAPAGTIMSPVSFGGMFFNDVSVGVVDSFTLNVMCDGAALEYGLGSASAQGLIQGNLTVTGSIKIFFQNFTAYANFQSETQGRMAFICKDGAGNAYVFTLTNAFLNNAKIDASGPNTAVYATYDLEGNPTASTGAVTMMIDALPVT